VKVLFLHHNQQDYLAESLFHGLRSLLGKSCIDIPRYDSMYAPLSDRMRTKLRGNGFTLYGLLEDTPDLAEDRFFWEKDLDCYDLIIIANIWIQWELFWKLFTLVPHSKLVVLDSSDVPALFPYTSLGYRLKNIPWSYLAPVSKVKYFKRELIGEGASYSLDRFFYPQLIKWIPLPNNVTGISFSIPAEKVSKVDTNYKVKKFQQHVVDQEIATTVDNSFFSSIGADRYTFLCESDYYEDLKRSQFGITTKRAGWDCLRHYELAANGCVICFRDLDSKPSSCAPHQLNSSNCISYNSLLDLQSKISALSEQDYVLLLEGTYKWVCSNTTVVRAQEFMNHCF
jgi:hypothetical protein